MLETCKYQPKEDEEKRELTRVRNICQMPAIGQVLRLGYFNSSTHSKYYYSNLTNEET